jgi:hypothetical protein
LKVIDTLSLLKGNTIFQYSQLKTPAFTPCWKGQ